MRNQTTKSIIRLCALALAALSLVSFASCKKKVDSPALEHSIMQFYSPADGMTTFFIDSKKLDDQIGGGITKIGAVDGTKGFVTAATALYHIDETGLLKIYPAAVTNAVLSLDGRFILFATSTEVFLYDHDKKAYDQLPDIACREVVGLVLSPDGSAAGVTVVNAENGVDSYTYIGGRTELYGKDRCIAAIGNGGKLSYYLEAPNGEVSGKLYFVSNGKATGIAENASNYFEVNRDLSEITFDMDGKTYYCKNGKNAKKLVDDSVFSYAGAQNAEQGGKAVTTLLKNCDTLLENVFYRELSAKHEDGYTVSQYNVYYINRSGSASSLAIGASQFTVAGDRSAILCVVDEVLYRISVFNPKKPETVARDVYTFCCSEDLKTIYPISTGGNLWRIEGGKSSNVLLPGIQLAKMMKNGVVLCYAPGQDGGSLLWLEGEYTNLIAQNVSFFEVYPQLAAYLGDYDSDANTYDLYISTDGKNFSLSQESVRIGN